jgi:4-amino-4-deoxy-L-arabinose transferase-like glycosyltransferase
LEWTEETGRRKLILAAAFAAFAAFTKNEGLALLPIIYFAAIIFASARRQKLTIDVFYAILVGMALIAPWLFYRHFLPHTHEDYGGKLSSLATVLNHLPRLRQVLPPYLEHLIEFNTVGGIWLVLIVTAWAGWRAFGRPPVALLWFILLAHLALYAVTFMVTPWELDVLIPMVTSKLLLHIAPAAALLIGMHLSQFRSARSPE